MSGMSSFPPSSLPTVCSPAASPGCQAVGREGQQYGRHSQENGQAHAPDVQVCKVREVSSTLYIHVHVWVCEMDENFVFISYANTF